MIPVQCVILFTKISRIGNKVVCLYSGNFRLNYVFIQLQKDRHICLILLLYFLLHQRSFLNFVVKNFQDDFQYFIFELCFCILIFGYVVGHESGIQAMELPRRGRFRANPDSGTTTEFNPTSELQNIENRVFQNAPFANGRFPNGDYSCL